jgi:cell division protein YceG involved in septum cleavage
MTLQEIADKTGAAYSTVAKYAQEAGWTQNGKQTLLDENQVTVILEAMKRANPNQYNLTSSLEGVETSKSAALQLDLLYRQIDAIKSAEIAQLKRELADNKALLKYRESALGFYQYLAEKNGDFITDKDDLTSAYRGYI